MSSNRFILNPHNGSGTLIMTEELINRRFPKIERNIDYTCEKQVVIPKKVPKRSRETYKPVDTWYPIVPASEKPPWLIKDPNTITNDETFIYFVVS